MIRIDQCLAHPYLEKLLPVIDGNKYRDSQLDNMHRVRDLGVPSTEWDVSIKLLLVGLRELCRGGCGKISRASEDGLHHGNCLSDPVGLMHTGIYRVWQHAQGFTGQVNMVLALRRGVDTSTYA